MFSEEQVKCNVASIKLFHWSKSEKCAHSIEGLKDAKITVSTLFPSQVGIKGAPYLVASLYFLFDCSIALSHLQEQLTCKLELSPFFPVYNFSYRRQISGWNPYRTLFCFPSCMYVSMYA